MEVLKQELPQSIEPHFLSEAKSSGVKLRIGQMNKTEHEGSVRDIGRYEINIDENGKTITILKQEIAYFTASQPVLHFPSDFPYRSREEQRDGGSDLQQSGRPNIQQEFLDKAIKENQVLTLFLITGQRIKANIVAYDNFTILLNEGNKQHLYYKHSITTINR